MIPEQCRDLTKLNPTVAAAARAALDECKRQGLNIGCSETLRTVDRQDYLYGQGRPKAKYGRPGNIVTNATGAARSSYHIWGLALDIFHNKKGDEYNAVIINAAAKIFKKHGFEWGGNFSIFKDSPHFQMTFNLSIADLKAGKQPPQQQQPAQVDEQYKNAVIDLSTKNMIGNPAAWFPAANIKLANVEALICKIGLIMLGTSGYTQTIQALAQGHIISSPETWLNKTYSAANVRDLIVKISSIK